MLIKCAGKFLVPLSAVKWCEDNGDAIVLFVGDRERFMCQGADAEALRALVIRPAPSPVERKEAKSDEKQEVVRSNVIPVLPGRTRR